MTFGRLMEKMSDTLFVITARGGSKGLPGKNIRNLCGKPLIAYSIDVARAFVSDEDICVSTDSQEIIEIVERYGLKVPFVRPTELATDSATSNDVLVHAVKFFANQGKKFKRLVLLQPTSPLRSIEDVQGAIDLYRSDIDMVVSVTKSHAPAVLCSDNSEGFVQLFFNKNAVGRQAVPEMYEYNGAVYVVNVASLMEKGLGGFTKSVKFVMNKQNSIDIDDIYDFTLVESIMKARA